MASDFSATNTPACFPGNTSPSSPSHQERHGVEFGDTLGQPSSSEGEGRPMATEEIEAKPATGVFPDTERAPKEAGHGWQSLGDTNRSQEHLQADAQRDTDENPGRHSRTTRSSLSKLFGGKLPSLQGTLSLPATAGDGTGAGHLPPLVIEADSKACQAASEGSSEKDKMLAPPVVSTARGGEYGTEDHVEA